MKKKLIVISCLLVLVMCMSIALTACAKKGVDDDTMMELVSTLKNTYNNKEHSASYTVFGEMPTTDAKGDPLTVYVKWELSGTLELYLDKERDSNGRYTVHFDSPVMTAFNYTLKFTLVNEKGKAYTNAAGEAYSATLNMKAVKATGGGVTPGGDSTGGDNQGGDDQQQGGGGGQQQGGGDSTVTTGNGTLESPYTVAQALDVISKQSGDFDYSGKVYVKGVVTGTVSTGSEGDYKFDIIDSGTTTQITVYYAAPNGKTVESGDTVVVSGSLVSYNGTKELTSHKNQDKTVVTPCQIESVTKGTGGSTGGDSGNTGGGTTSGNGVTVNGKTITIDFAAMGYANAQQVTSLTAGSLTLTFAKGSTGKTDPAYYNSGSSFRLYGGNTMTITGATVTGIVFTFGTSDGTNEISVSTGTLSNGTWTGSSNNLVFTVGGTSGHRRIAKMVITIA